MEFTWDRVVLGIFAAAILAIWFTLSDILQELRNGNRR
jgi:hypothetical protein